MTKQNDIFQVGEVVRHNIFGVGVVIEYLFAEDPEKEHNRIGVDFEDYGHKWLIAAPGYLQKEQISPDGVNQKRGAERWLDIYKATFVSEDDGDHHSMGAHWQPFCDDPEEIIATLPKIIGQALLQTGFGNQIKGRQIPSNWVSGFHLSWPIRTHGLTMTLKQELNSNELKSVYPFYAEGSQVSVTLDQVLVWKSGVEAQLTVSPGNTELTFFDTTFLINRHLYQSGKRFDFILTGIAYSAEPAEVWNIPMPGYDKLVRWLENNDNLENVASEQEEPTLSSEGAAIFLPIGDWDRDDYQFQGPVKQVKPVEDMLGQSGWLLDVTVLRGIYDRDEDFDLRILMTKRAWSGQEPPEVGQDIRGTLWLQGYLWSNYSGRFVNE